MTANDTLRHATDVTKDGVLHAAEVVGPYAGSAKAAAMRYAGDTRDWLAPHMEQARDALPPKVSQAVGATAEQTRRAADYTLPRVERAVGSVRSAAEPRLGEAVLRSSAAAAALRNHVTAAQIEKLARKHRRRAARGRFAKGVLVAGLVGGAAVAGWKWWSKQTNPDWLVEPAEPTDMHDRATLAAESKNGSGPAEELDPEVQAKLAESEAADRRDGTV